MVLSCDLISEAWWLVWYFPWARGNRNVGDKAHVTGNNSVHICEFLLSSKHGFWWSLVNQLINCPKRLNTSFCLNKFTHYGENMPTVVKNIYQYCLHDRLVKLVTECLTILNTKVRLQCGLNKHHEVNESGSASVHPETYWVTMTVECVIRPIGMIQLRKIIPSKGCSGTWVNTVWNKYSKSQSTQSDHDEQRTNQYH